MKPIMDAKPKPTEKVKTGERICLDLHEAKKVGNFTFPK